MSNAKPSRGVGGSYVIDDAGVRTLVQRTGPQAVEALSVDATPLPVEPTTDAESTPAPKRGKMKE